MIVTIAPQPVVTIGDPATPVVENTMCEGEDFIFLAGVASVTNETSFTWSSDGCGVFANANVGTGKTVTVDSITLADGNNGGLASNYSVTPGQTTTANITAKSLTVSGIIASSKT